MFQELPSCITKYTFISRGATGWIFQIDEQIALKYVRKGRLQEFKTENEIFDLFERQEPPPPCLIQSFFHLPGINFLPFMTGESLDYRIYGNQRRDEKQLKCLEVLRLEPKDKMEKWALELSTAIAWLESLGLVHGDLRPANILLDAKDCLKLADFDCISKIGSINPGNAAPWARLLGAEAGHLRGRFGWYGATSEQFTFGSILYFLTRGFEPYDDIDGPVAINLLMDMKFPTLPDSQLDRIIGCCWHGAYPSLSDLANKIAALRGTSTTAATEPFPREYVDKVRQRCRELLVGELSGILDADQE